MPEAKSALVRVPTLKTAGNFRDHLASLGLSLPCDDDIETGAASPLSRPVEGVLINGKRLGNRFAVQPMEGWDGSRAGGVTDNVLRRWTRFGESGAKLICGGEAMAVRPDGRANPHQLIICDGNKSDLARLRAALIEAHRQNHGATDDLVIGFQLTHSGRFCRPNDQRLESHVAFRHPMLDKKFHIVSDAQVFTDAEIRDLIGDYVRAAKIAWDAGADFVDIKHCHGYLLHEFLGAFTRPGPYGGSFVNRTRILREIVEGIRASGNKIELGVRLSAFDTVPFKPDPARAQPGKLGPGVPEDFPVPYRYGFGIDPQRPLEHDLTEPLQFVRLCAELGVKILNVTAGSPYHCPHIQRPAAYPPSDGYQPPHDPLIDVARQIEVTRQIKAAAGPGMIIVGSAYSYLQEFLPLVAQAVLRQGWADVIGLGRMMLSYPTMPSETLGKGALSAKLICRTFSDCTTAPRNGLVSGCYPLDKYYGSKPEAEKLKALKKAV
ncbi:MAG TPA: NADH:flavin oxidoreductase [Verrucomicrobiae bacterium]|jgi:2,4-dienoyl-CoA reductase-like NADH-dependent reductase (Old Yellow Enzyme family)|nr:NADH:flavin oxidoreductase [Verrucomicrobiae bacterium]